MNQNDGTDLTRQINSRTNSNRSEYFRARYKARRNAERICSYCGAKTSVDEWKAERCHDCIQKFVSEVRRLFVDEGKTLSEIGLAIDDKKKYTGERVRQLYGQMVAGGFTGNERETHATNLKRKRIEEKTSKKIPDIIAIVKASHEIYTARRFSNELGCSWEMGRMIVDYLLLCHKKEVGKRVASYSKEGFLDAVRVDLDELANRKGK